MRVGFAIAVAIAAWVAPDPAGAAEPIPPGSTETFEVGLGVLGFVGHSTDVQAPSALAWLMRYGWTPQPGVNWEWTYTGATTTVLTDPTGRPTVMTLAEADLKLDLVQQANAHPFVGAGVGFGGFSGRHYQATLTTPLLAGIQADLGDVLLSTRVTGRPAFFDPVTQPLDTWSWTLDIASRF